MHKLVVRYKVIYWPHELPTSVKTCTQLRPEVATISVRCGESPASKTDCMCRIFGSCHLQTAHTSVRSLRSVAVHGKPHCSVYRHSGSIACSRSYAVARIFPRGNTGQELPTHLCASNHVRPWCSTVDHSATRQPHAMLPHATDWYRGSSVVAGRLRNVGGIRPA